MIKLSWRSNTNYLNNFRRVRDATRRDAVVYCDKVLPLANRVVTNISLFFDNYIALDLKVRWDVLSIYRGIPLPPPHGVLSANSLLGGKI